MCKCITNNCIRLLRTTRPYDTIYIIDSSCFGNYTIPLTRNMFNLFEKIRNRVMTFDLMAGLITNEKVNFIPTILLNLNFGHAHAPKTNIMECWNTLIQQRCDTCLPLMKQLTSDYPIPRWMLCIKKICYLKHNCTICAY